jgi:hypothetical protein
MFWKLFWPTAVVVAAVFLVAPLAHAKGPIDDVESIGWMKSSDVSCNTRDNEVVCFPVDHYTDAYQRGEDCATYGVPFFDRPHGTPVGLLFGEEEITLGEKSQDGRYTRVYAPPGHHKKDVLIIPYSLKALHACA